MNVFILTSLNAGLFLAESGATSASTGATSAPAVSVTGWGFWGLLLAACLVWYSTVTIYVAIRGVLDIKHMLGRLKEQAGADATGPRT